LRILNDGDAAMAGDLPKAGRAVVKQAREQYADDAVGTVRWAERNITLMLGR
jgi:hypothetical protein